METIALQENAPDGASIEELRRRIRTLEAARAALERENREFTRMFSMVLDMICVADLRTACFLKINPAFKTTLGYSEEELLGRPFFDFIHPEDDPETRRVFEERLRTGDRIIHFENRYRCRNGTYKWLSWTSHPNMAEGFTYAVARDITPIKVTEKHLRESEEKYKNLFNSINDGICLHELVYDGQTPVDYRVLEINPRYEALTGIAHEDARGALASALYGASEAPYLEIYADVVRTGTPVSFETYFPPLERHFLISVFSPGPHRFATVFQDITERKRAEKAKSENEARIRASLVEKEVLLKEVHHRVKNNMQVISSLVDLQAGEVADPAVRAIFQDVVFRVRSMAMVHEKLYQSDDLARIDFADYARSLLSYLWRAIGPSETGIRLDQALAPVRLPINQAVPCGLILNELFANALKHAFDGRREGRVSVSLEEDEKGRIHLTVADDGAGLPTDVDWRSASSLGLRLVQMLARQLHAEVAVDSGPGTRFTIAFQKTNPF